MLLGGIILQAVQNVNSFRTAPQVTVRQGNATTVYFRLVDLEQTDAYGQPLRYIPASGSVVTATIGALDQDNVINRLCAMPFSADDRSIFSFNLLSTDKVNQGNLDISLFESSVTKTTTIANGIIVWSNSPSLC